MGKVVWLAMAFIVYLSTVQAVTDTYTLKKFCLAILKQSENDASQCYLKPMSFSLEGSDNAIVAFLCCLGFFHDVRHDYTYCIADDLAKYIAALTSETNLIELASFIVSCQNYAKPTGLNVGDFQAWLATGKTIATCNAK